MRISTTGRRAPAQIAIAGWTDAPASVFFYSLPIAPIPARETRQVKPPADQNKERRSIMRSTLLVILCLGMFPVAAGAQTLDTPPARPRFLFEAMHPSYEGDDAAVSSGAYILSGRVPVSPTASVRFDLPFSYLRETYSPPIPETSSSLGNPFIGLSLQRSANMDFDFGLRPSLADETETANLYAAFADLSRWEAFVPNLWTISGQARWHHVTPAGLNWEI